MIFFLVGISDSETRNPVSRQISILPLVDDTTNCFIDKVFLAFVADNRVSTRAANDKNEKFKIYQKCKNVTCLGTRLIIYIYTKTN